jgi:hypothetical protein
MKRLHKFVGALLCAALLAACAGNGGIFSSMPTAVAPGSNYAPVTFASFKLAAAKAKPEFVLDVGAVTGNLYVYQVTGSGNALIGVIPTSVPGLTHSREQAGPDTVTPSDTEYKNFHPVVLICYAFFKWLVLTSGAKGKTSSTGEILEYTAVLKNDQLQMKYVGTLQQSGNGGPGLTVDSAGNVYASNLNTNAVDVFSAAEVKSGSGTPVRTIHTKLLARVYWLAAAGKTLLANGLDKGGNYDVTDVNVKTGADKLANQLCTSKTSNPCYPGGMAVGPRPSADLYVNNQTNRTISAYAPPWTGGPASTVSYPSTDLVVAIALDTKNNLLWGGNQDEADGFTCGSQFYDAADNLGFSVPLKSIQTNTPPYGACVSGVPEWDVFSGTATTSMFKT